MPAPASTMPEAASTSPSASSPVRSSSTPPNTGTDAPHTPLRPAAGVTGTVASLHAARTADTSSVDVGAGDHRRPPRHLAVERPVQGERPPVARRARRLAVEVGDRLADRAESLDEAVRAVRPDRPASRSAVPASSIGGRGVVMWLLPRVGDRGARRRPARRRTTTIGVDLGDDLVVAPAEVGCQHGCEIMCRPQARRPILEVGPGPPGQHVDQVGRHLVSHCVDRFGAQIAQARNHRLAERRVERDQGLDLGRLGAVAAGQVCVRMIDRDTLEAGCADERQLLGAAPGATAELAEDFVDRVLGHRAIGRELAAGDRDQPGLADGDAVAAGEVGGASRSKLASRAAGGPPTRRSRRRA